MEAYEYDGSSTESETYEGDFESVVTPYENEKTESINILALGDALAFQYPPQDVSTSLMPAPEPINVAGQHQQQHEELCAEPIASASLKSELQEQDVIVISELSDDSESEAMADPVAAAEEMSTSQLAPEDVAAQERPHPTCDQCSNLLLLIGDGGDAVVPEDKLQCNCCKRIFARKVYSKTQVDRQENAHCLACTGNQKKCRALERIVSAGPLICRACQQLLPANAFSSSQKSPLNDAVRRCTTCIEKKVIGGEKSTWNKLKTAAREAVQHEKEDSIEYHIGRIKHAWEGLKRKKADFERRGSKDAAYAARLKKEEKALKFREFSQRKRDAEVYDKILAKLDPSKKNSGKNTKNKSKRDTMNLPKKSAPNKGSASKSKSSNKRSARKAALKEGITQIKKPRVTTEGAQ